MIRPATPLREPAPNPYQQPTYTTQVRGGNWFNLPDFSGSGPRMLLGGRAGSFGSGGAGASYPSQSAWGTPGYGGASAEPDYFSELSSIRDTNRGVAQTALDGYRSSLDRGINDYQTGASGMIDRYGGELSRLSSDYLSKSDADISADEEERRKLRLNARNASRLGVTSAINDGTRASKAMFSARGGGGSSYADRLAIGIRAKAETEAAQRMSDMEREDAMAVRGARRGRDTLALNMGRSDAGALYGDRSRLFSDVSGRRLASTGTVYGEQSRINTNDANAQRADLAATRIITPTTGSLLPQAERFGQPNPYRLSARNRARFWY